MLKTRPFGRKEWTRKIRMSGEGKRRVWGERGEGVKDEATKKKSPRGKGSKGNAG